MAPYNFDAPDSDTDIILRSSDEKEFHVHRLILSLASPVFQGMFSLPQSTDPPSQIPTIDVPESSELLQPFLQYLYPRSPPEISDLPMWEAIYSIADKYAAEVVMDHLKTMLIHRFLETSPLRVYALASHWGFKEMAKTASTGTLTVDVFKNLSMKDAELMGGAPCLQLLLLHFNRRLAAEDIVVNQPLPSSSVQSQVQSNWSSPDQCNCSNSDYSAMVPFLCQVLTTRPSLTAEEIYDEAANWNYSQACRNRCRKTSQSVRSGNSHTFQDVQKYLSSILKALSKLPQTI